MKWLSRLSTWTSGYTVLVDGFEYNDWCGNNVANDCRRRSVDLKGDSGKTDQMWRGIRLLGLHMIGEPEGGFQANRITVVIPTEE